MKLDISIAQVGCHVAMQIHSMDERFRAEGETNKFIASNGINVVSCNQPELGDDSVYLLGEEQYCDHGLESIKFDTSEEAEEYLSKVLVALKEWATEWDGWNDNKETASNSTTRYQF
jgi:dihydroxyacetone kinase